MVSPIFSGTVRMSRESAHDEFVTTTLPKGQELEPGDYVCRIASPNGPPKMTVASVGRSGKRLYHRGGSAGYTWLSLRCRDVGIDLNKSVKCFLQVVAPARD